MSFAAFTLCLPVSLMANEPVSPLLKHEVKSLEGKPVKLSDYQGKVLLIVNVASFCGATPQYQGLQKLHESRQGQGLVVLGFPCNQFGRQEPGSAEEIREFCTRNYQVTFPVMEKVNVNGNEASPLFQDLTSKETNPKHGGPIRWNFEKFLISRDGKVAARFGTGVEPDDETFLKAVDAELARE